MDRSQLPDEFTPDTVRAMGLRTARYLARPGNGILTPDEQVAFDSALREVLQDSTARLDRARRGGRPPADADLRRSYQRTRHRLDDQARRARHAFPQLTEGWEDVPAEPEAEVEVEDVSVGSFESEIEQTSDTLELLGQIATIQQQQLEHQQKQLLSETRGLFFALAVSVAVIVASIAPSWKRHPTTASSSSCGRQPSARSPASSTPSRGRSSRARTESVVVVELEQPLELR